MKKLSVLFFFFRLCHGVNESNECTMRGRFPNDDVENCRGYTICLMAGPDNYIQYKLACPVGFIYSHFEHQCTNSTDYQCLPTYNCTLMGVFPDPASEFCTSYIACVNGTSETVTATARVIKCPSETVFNPNVGVCVNTTDYRCKDDLPIIDNPPITPSFVIENASVKPFDFSLSFANSLYTNFIFTISFTVLIFL